MTLGSNKIGVGKPEYAAQLLRDLYIDLRSDLAKWANVTKQTPQPRMGYVGQHLVSVVTGFPGGRSGARGHDLVLPDGKFGEIKCCYRVDQLGACSRCGTAVASIELHCPNEECKSEHISRRDDSKWLLSPRSEQELLKMLVPRYYFVLFEFQSLIASKDIDVKIFEIDPASPGFSLCLIDYFFNIRSKSKSKAPFNLWPHSPKFFLMQPKLNYWSIIKDDGAVKTEVFCQPGEGHICPLPDLGEFARSGTLTEASIDRIMDQRKISRITCDRKATSTHRCRLKLAHIQNARIKQNWDSAALADDFAWAVYSPLIESEQRWIDEHAQWLKKTTLP